MQQYSINTNIRARHFLAQCSHESQGFTNFVENTNYTSAERLVKIFPTHFLTLQVVSYYINKPIAIANTIYADRLGNGNYASGDGWKYRGAGIIQITGKTAQLEAVAACGLKDNTDLAKTDGAVHSACWWWDKHNLNTYADQDLFTGETRVINGGTNGLPDRLSWLGKYKKFYS